MKTNDTLGYSRSINDRPWWQVRRTLSGALFAVCAGFGALWFEADVRAVMWEMFVLPLAGTVAFLVRSDLAVALPFSTAVGLLVGRTMRRERARQGSALPAQLTPAGAGHFPG